jgi:alginate O-acetyltransferase complex protein AlgI
MAIGLGKMFGFTYKENFNYPYLARSATDFWRRWHISLSSFFRDYVYIPLGGNRTRPLVSLTVVWFLTGLWHGASWNFVVWGLFYGVLILFERAVQSLTGKEIPRIVGHPYAILATLVGWTLFYFTDLGHAFAHLGRMFGVSGASLTDPAVLISIRANVFFLGLLILACFPVWPFLAKLLRGDPVEPGNARLGVLLPFLNLFLVAFSTVLLVGRTYNPFLYFRF